MLIILRAHTETKRVVNGFIASQCEFYVINSQEKNIIKEA